MSRVLTNNTTIEVAREVTLGVLPGTPTWKLLEPNGVPAIGAEITTVPRNPISKTRQRRKGTVTDLDSTLEFEHDVTMELLQDFLDGFFFSRYASPTIIRHLQSGANFQSLAADNDPPPAGTDAGYTHSALSGAIPANTLVFSRGFPTNSINNGLKLVLTGSTTTATLISTALIDETPTEQANASLDVCGRRFVTSDLSITVTGTSASIVSATVDLTTLGLTVGQFIHVGGLTGANRFSAGFGYARIRTIATTTITVDKFDGKLLTDPGTGESVDLMFGRFVRNVAIDSADFLLQSFQFEEALVNLQNPGPGDEYIYSLGNLSNSLALSVPLTEKSVATIGFVGTDTQDPTTSRKTNAGTPLNPVQTAALSTTSDVLRLRITEVDETGLTTCFKNVTVTILNNVSAEKCIGTLGAVFMNNGNFDIDIEAQILFTDSDVVKAIRANRTVTMEAMLRNEDSGAMFDFPSMTLGGGDQELPLNESVLLNLTGQTFQDASLGTSLSCSLFPAAPTLI